MGKGDKKTKRGKLFSNSYGITRPRKKVTKPAYVKSTPKKANPIKEKEKAETSTLGIEKNPKTATKATPKAEAKPKAAPKKTTVKNASTEKETITEPKAEAKPKAKPKETKAEEKKTEK